MSNKIIFKILTAADWQKAQAGADVQAPVDIVDGYVHFSTATQVQETLNKWFTGEEGAVLLAYSASDFPSLLRWERSRNEELFPHVYGRVNAKQAKSVWTMEMGPNGAPIAPPEALEFAR
ncbi:MAG: hypothetical protein CME88_16345 [Hirschia sp.]|nr:hypothetical protein [Hirschia sp.]MBF19947.1 hypothetical protein [Hirschia sp.]|tara:strand:+ start:1106 stop:1465 length:360 start_codon:yes stop_codon:yes gene_type:complete